MILSACGGGSGTGKQSDFSGFVIKGPLQNAKVFADYNNDGILNDDEPTVLTNSDGSYLLSALDSFGAIVVQTDDSTIDTSSGEILSGVILKAPKGAQVVSPTSTMVVESNLTVSEIAEVLGLPSDFTLDFNPFDANADKDKAAVVEKTSQMLMSTINAVSASAEGIGLSKNDAFKTAIEAIVEVVKDNITSKSTIDLAEDAVLDQVSSAAVIAATKRGADENSMNRAVNDAVTNTKQVNKSIKLIQDVFSSEAKDVFKQVASVRETAKVAAEKIQAAEELKVSGGAISLPDITIRSVAEDGIINASEKYTSFKVSGTALSDSVVTVTFGTVTRTVTVGKSETEWEVEFNFTSSEITALKNGEYPTVLKAEGDKGGYKFEVERNVELIETPPSGSISDLGGDGVINITELQSGILVKGTSNATSGGKVTVKILKASDDSVVQNYTPIETITNSNGAWSVSLGSTNFPQENFKIQATIENQYGNTKTITSEAITVDFNAPSVSNISSSASGSIATGDVTYTITFDDTVKFFTASSLNITNGSVNNVTTVSGQNDKQYKVVITPNANSEGSITVAIPEGGAFDGSGNKNTSFSNSDQKFDTKAPSVSSVSVLETGTTNTVSTVSGTVDLKIILSEDINASNFTKSDLNVSSGTLGTVSPSSGTTNTFTVPYTPASGTDSNITLTILGGGYQDQVGNSGKSGTKVFAVDSKGPTGVLSVPTGSFSLGQKLEFSLTYDENITVPVSGEDPFLVLQIGDRVRMATKESSSDSSVLKFSYTVSNSDLDSDGIGVITTTGLSKGVFNLSGTFAAGDTIAVSNNKSGSFSVQSGATSSTAVATQLRTFLNSDSAFSSTNSLKAVGLGSGKIALVGDSADTLSLSISTGGSSTGSVAKEVSESYSAAIKDSFDNNANSVFSISGDPTGITVDGGSKGVGVDGYVEGVSIFSDNDGDGQLNFGDATATTNPTGVFNMYGATGPLVMSGGTDKATGLPFGVQYEAPAGYTVINPISSIIRSIETKDSTNTGTDATAAAEQKVANSIGANVKFESFDAYNAVSTPSEIPNAIAYQKAAASVALVVDIASTGFVELVKTIEKTSTVNDPYKIENQADPFTTQKASELVFDAIADAIISGEIGSGELKSFGSSSGTVDDMTSKLLEIITPTAQNILGNNYENYKSALNNEAMVLAAGVNRIEEKPFSSDSFPTTTEDAINALTKIIQTQSVWQGDANRALEDDSTDNDWLSFNDTLTGGVTFTPVNSSGAEITKNTAGYLELNEGGYLLKVNGQPINSSTHSVKWYRVTLSENSDVISDTHTTAPTMNRVEVDGSNTVFGTDVLRVAAGGSPGDSQDALKSKGLTFEIKLNSDNSTIISKENAPVFRADTFILNENLADNIFAWGGLADGASVGVVVPTSYQISSSIDDRNKFEGGSDGEGAEYSFTVTRQGNMSQTQSIDYEVQTSQTLTAEDFDGGEIPSGTITFAPEESTKTLTIRIKNDTIKETDESFNVRLKDDIGTAQILDDVVSFAIFDDDPTNPQLSLVNTQALTVTAADGNNDTTLDFTQHLH